MIDAHTSDAAGKVSLLATGRAGMSIVQWQGQANAMLLPLFLRDARFAKFAAQFILARADGCLERLGCC